MGKKLPVFTFRTLINNYGHYIKAKLGMEEKDIETDFNNYKYIQSDSRVRDYMWSLFNKSIIKDDGIDIYREMGRFVARYEGKNGNQYHRIALKMEFEEIKRKFSLSKGMVKSGFYLIGDKNCPHSMRLDGKHEFANYQQCPPLATDECSLQSCTCCIGNIALRDENDNLIWL